MKATSRGLSGGKHNQVIIVSNTRNRSRVCLFLTTENEPFFILKAIMVNYGWKLSLGPFIRGKISRVLHKTRLK